jgi:hypothetical protein
VDLKEILLTHHSSIASREQGVAFINQHPEFFPSLLELTCTPQEKRENILASWILDIGKIRYRKTQLFGLLSNNISKGSKATNQ